MDDTTCRGCGAPTTGRQWHAECLDGYRRSHDYRAQTLQRDGYDCARCSRLRNWWVLSWVALFQRLGLRQGPRRVEADHIDPLGLSGTHDPRNLQMLCRPHHKRKTRRDVAKMRGRRVPASLGQKVRWALVILALYLGWRVGATTLLGVDDVEMLNDPLGALRQAAPRLAVLALLVALVLGALAYRRRVLRRLHHAVAAVTGASETARRPLRVHRWGRVGLRLVPVDVTIRYPRTFADTKAGPRRDVEAVVAAKLGWTDSVAARWDPVRDRVRLTTPDPFVTGKPLPWPWITKAGGTLWDPIPVGVDREGDEVAIRLVERNLMCGGEPGGGKSNAFSMLLAAAANDPMVDLHLIDLKKVEQKVWEPCAKSYATTYEEAVQTMRDLVEVMDLRYDLLLLDGKLKVEGPEDGFELVVLAIDELAALTAVGEKKQRDAFADLLRDLISRGRAAGIIVLLATQRPSHDVVPTSIRDLVGFKWAMRCTTHSASDMILGDGWAHSESGASAARIHPSARGTGWLLAEGGQPRLVRSYFMPADTRDALAARAAVARGVESTRATPGASDGDGFRGGAASTSSDGGGSRRA